MMSTKRVKFADPPKADDDDEDVGPEMTSYEEGLPPKFNPSPTKSKNTPNLNYDEGLPLTLEGSKKRSIILGELEDELERQLEEKAKRNELSGNDVKRVLRDVLTQEDVSKYVESTVAKSDELSEYQLKMTRAKAKELIDRIPKIAPLLCLPTPQKKSDIGLLIREEFPEDSSDEEYQPLDETVEEDDDGMLVGGEEASTALIGCSTPAQALLPTGLDENIGQRTRSKLSLSETPLETIEQAFIPPDITEDMYDTECDNQDWLNFLKDLVQPLDTSVGQEAHDDENDPEYNIQPDELKAPDNEELRADPAVKISKKEINDLIDELLDYTNAHEDGFPSDEEKPKDNKPSSHVREPQYSISEPYFRKPPHQSDLQYSAVEERATSPSAPITLPVPVQKCVKIPSMLSKEQHLLIRQQLGQHEQLLLQTLLLSCGSPFVRDDIRAIGKSCIMELKSHKDSATVADSAFSQPTLDKSLELLSKYETFVNANQEAMLKWNQEKASHNKYVKTPRAGCAPIHPVLMKLCLRSRAFPYPLLLPRNGFRDTTKCRASNQFSLAQERLITSGLQDCALNLGIKMDDTGIVQCSSLIHKALIPDQSPEQIYDYIKRKSGRRQERSPINQFIKFKYNPGVEHFVVTLDQTNLQPLYLRDTKLLDIRWHKALYEERDKAQLALKKRKLSQSESLDVKPNVALARKKTS